MCRLFLWTSAAETNSLQLLYTRLSALPPPAVQPLRAQKHILSYRALRPINSDPAIQNNSIYQISLPHHQVDPASLFWIHDDMQSLSVLEMGASFTEIQARMDTGWQDRQGTTVTLEGRGFEWGRDWRIWCANLKQANRYRGVVVEVRLVPSMAHSRSNMCPQQIFLTQSFYSRNSRNATSSGLEKQSDPSGGSEYTHRPRNPL